MPDAVRDILRESLLRWFAVNGRALPWRETKDAYAIWLSEVILQQTRIQQGTAYWQRFMSRYPTVETLAAASEDEVMRLWQGLGYYSRARNLHAAARQIVEEGHFPRTFEELRRLKGVGDYTAAAVASIAYDEPVAVVDGNVYRVLSRYFGIDTPINTTQGKKLFAALAQEVLPPSQASAFNQAMMDFGAIHCTPKSPLCPCCPLSEACEALRTSKVEQLPAKQKTVKVRERRMAFLILRHQGKTALGKRPGGDIWQGLWQPIELPVIGEDESGQPRFDEARLQELTARTGFSPLLTPPYRTRVKHVLTHRILYVDFYRMESEGHPQLPEGYQWVEDEDIDHYGLPRIIEKEMV